MVTDHDSRVLALRTLPARAWELGDLLDWAVDEAAAACFVSVTVALRADGALVAGLDQLAAQRGLPLVCVQPLLATGETRGRT